MKNLVIVESPGKVKTIGKFLGKDYVVMSSVGHIRDLRKKDFGIDIDNDFTPVYEIPDDKKAIVKDLKSAAAKADMVWLASDEDREGEAIAWHLYEVLGLKPENTRRIVFHEITKPAILNAIEHPRSIDLDKVNAQQARRVMDRLVGFELSPVLWKKIKPSLSAGRVQSVVVRLVCEREREIKAFKTESFFRVNALFNIPGADTPLKAELNRRLPSETDAKAFLEACKTATYTVKDVTVKPVKRSPAPPFTTSTLQQEASSRLGFTVHQTMMLAQRLYERGLITYMRTDSVNLSSLALSEMADLITSEMGAEYHKTRKYHTKSKGAQEAHEAIRPTYAKNRTIDGTAQEKRLYDLIWKRAIASQMADAELERTNIDISISNRQEEFGATGETITFDGFMKVYGISESADEKVILPRLAAGSSLTAQKVTATQSFTQAPPRYNEKMLVRKMEELGIGRPSTYDSTISTVQTRGYVSRGENEGEVREYDVLTLENNKIESSRKSERFGSDKGKLVPTDVGLVVNEFLIQYFPDILDYNFTARVEEKFDEISEGKLGWKKEVEDFYSGFHPNIRKVSDMRMDHKVGERILGKTSDGKPVSVKIGRFGPVVQIGDTSGDEKPRFASLQKGQSIESITLDEALHLFDLPREVGEIDGKPVIVAEGRFGPYVKYDGLFVSIPREMSPMQVTLDEAAALIEKKRESEKQKHIKNFPENPEVEILNGRYGPYIAYRKDGAKKAVNYKIPKDKIPADLTLEETMQIIQAQDAAPRKRATRKKA